MSKPDINKFIEEIIDSADNARRAAPLPFLLTRVNAKLTRAKDNVWEKAVGFIGRPAIAISGLLMMILLNISVVMFNRTDPFSAAIDQTNQADDFFYNAVAIYDIENTQP